MHWVKKASILGSIFFICIFLVKPIGVSTQYSVLSGIIHKTINRNIIYKDDNNKYGYGSTNEYYNKDGGKIASHIENPLNYDFIFVLSIPIGGYIGSLIYKKDNNYNQISEKNDFEHRGFIVDYGPSFISGLLLLYGARLANGCTSGHMMSGMMQGSISGYAFAGSVFLIAIPTSIIVSKVRRGRRSIF